MARGAGRASRFFDFCFARRVRAEGPEQRAPTVVNKFVVSGASVLFKFYRESGPGASPDAPVYAEIQTVRGYTRQRNDKKDHANDGRMNPRALNFSATPSCIIAGRVT